MSIYPGIDLDDNQKMKLRALADKEIAKEHPDHALACCARKMADSSHDLRRNYILPPPKDGKSFASDRGWETIQRIINGDEA